MHWGHWGHRIDNWIYAKLDKWLSQFLSSRAPWTKCNIAATAGGELRIASDGKRIRIRCADFRFDPNIEMDLDDFKRVLVLVAKIGVQPHPTEPGILERKDLELSNNS